MERIRNAQWRLGTVLLLLLFACTAVAQTQFGTINGRVTDKTGAVVVDATVTLTDTATQTTREAKTGADGTFRVDLPLPGQLDLSSYEIYLSSLEDAYYNAALSD